MKKLEYFLAFATILCLCIKLFDFPLGNFLNIMGSSALAMFYLFSGYFIVNELSFEAKDVNVKNPGFFETMLGILTGVFISVAVIGLMFYVQDWPGGLAFLIIGNMGLSITLFASFFRFKSWSIQPAKAVMSRALLFIMGTAVFAFIRFVI